MPSDRGAEMNLASLNGSGRPQEPVRLGDFVYEFAAGQLISSKGENTYLRAQSALVLGFLARQLGQLVKKEDLIQQVWPDLIVTDDSLTQCIRDIRLALMDGDRQILMTVPKQGFILFGAPVSAEEARRAQGGQIRPIGPSSTEAKKSEACPESNVITPQLDPRDVMPTLAVLPFKGIATKAVDVLGFLIADEIARLLGLGNDVNVISRMSTGTLGGEPLGFVDLRNKLNADFILSGYLAYQGNQVSVSLEFAETGTGYVLWAELMQVPFDSTSYAIEGLDQVVADIRRTIMANEVKRLHSHPIRDLKLFSILHGAVGLMHRLSPTDFKRAKGYLDQLHEKVPHHPAPLAWMARWHALNAVQGWAEDPRRESEAALEHTARALDLDPNHTLALVCEGQVLVHLSRDLTAAEERYDQALANDPNDANGCSLRGMSKAFSDRGGLGIRDTERALHLTPLDPHRFMYLALAAGTCLATEDYARAVQLAKESLRLNRSHLSTLRMLAVAQLGTGDGDAARKTTAELLALQPKFRVSEWLRAAPSAEFKNGRRFADMLRQLGLPE